MLSPPSPYRDIRHYTNRKRVRVLKKSTLTLPSPLSPLIFTIAYLFYISPKGQKNGSAELKTA